MPRTVPRHLALTAAAIAASVVALVFWLPEPGSDEDWNPRAAQRQQLRYLAARIVEYADRHGRPAFFLDSVAAHLDSAHASVFNRYRVDVWGDSVLYFWNERGFQLKSESGYNWPSERATAAADSVRPMIQACTESNGHSKNWACMFAIDRRLSILEEYGWPQFVAGRRNSLGQYVAPVRTPIAVAAPRVARAAHSPDIAFVVTPTPRSGAMPGELNRLGLKVMAARNRGRVDVLTRPEQRRLRAGHVELAPTIALPGYYYLFDTAGFILVRPAAKDFSSFEHAELSFNYDGRRDGWPWFRLGGPRIDTIAGSDSSLIQHSRYSIYWHLDLVRDSTCVSGDCSANEVARGRTIVTDAPANWDY